ARNQGLRRNVILTDPRRKAASFVHCHDAMKSAGAVAVPISRLSRTAELPPSTFAGTHGSCRGYALSELVAVVAIIGLMASAAVPCLLSARPEATGTRAARPVQGARM